MRPATIVGAALLLAAPLGCQKVWGFEDFEEGAAGSSSGGAGGSSGTGGAAGSGTCTDANAPKDMVGFKLPSGKCVWIDTYEVSVASYDGFTAAVPVTALNQPPCQAKQTAEDFAAGCNADAAVPTGDSPVTCVDWCDARAYCANAGKILCPEDWTSPNETEKSWWYAACSSNGQFAYPGSDTPDESACNYSNNATWGCGAGCTLAPAEAANCKTPNDVYNLSGNVEEWVDGCASTADTAQCHVRGGSVQKTAPDSKCTQAQAVPRDFRGEFTGFRCCWEPSS